MAPPARRLARRDPIHLPPSGPPNQPRSRSLSSEVEETGQTAALRPLWKAKAAAPPPRDTAQRAARLDTRPVPAPRVSTARAPHVRAASSLQRWHKAAAAAVVVARGRPAGWRASS